jgi:hypothetical protein
MKLNRYLIRAVIDDNKIGGTTIGWVWKNVETDSPFNAK